MEGNRFSGNVPVGLVLGTVVAIVALSVMGLSPAFLARSSTVAAAAISTPVRMGYPGGDDWEPAVASDGQGNVYYLITHFGGVPGCSACASATIMLQVSRDRGATFSAPTPMTTNPAAQFDPQVKVNAQGTVFVSYLMGKDTVLQRSTDHGATWTNPVIVNVGIRSGLTDKDGLAVDGSNVYVGFDIGQRFFVGVSHDSGNTFAVSMMNSHTIGWTLNGGAAVGPDGSVYLAWETFHQSGNALGLQDEIVTYSHDHGATWNWTYVARGLPAGPDCGWPNGCGWAFLGTGSAVSVDGAGTVYAVFNAPLHDQGPPYIWLSRSTDGGVHWSTPQMVNTDGTAAWHAFPAVAAGAAGDVRVSWMDNHTGAFNVWYRALSSSNSPSSASQVSQYAAGYPYITQQGFGFPYGDYMTLNLDPSGAVQMAWGEGPNYHGPGNCFYAHG